MLISLDLATIAQQLNLFSYSNLDQRTDEQASFFLTGSVAHRRTRVWHVFPCGVLVESATGRAAFEEHLLLVYFKEMMLAFVPRGCGRGLIRVVAGERGL